MTKLSRLVLILFLCCQSFGAVAEDQISATVTVTVLPTDGDLLTANGDTRTWRETPSDVTSEIDIHAAIGGNATNLFNHVTAYNFTSPFLTMSLVGTNAVKLTAPVGEALTVTANGGWATVTMNTQSMVLRTNISVPQSALPTSGVRQQLMGQLASDLETWSTNSFTAETTLMENFLSLTADATITGALTFTNDISFDRVRINTLTNATFEVGQGLGLEFLNSSFSPVAELTTDTSDGYPRLSIAGTETTPLDIADPDPEIVLNRKMGNNVFGQLGVANTWTATNTFAQITNSTIYGGTIGGPVTISGTLGTVTNGTFKGGTITNSTLNGVTLAGNNTISGTIGTVTNGNWTTPTLSGDVTVSGNLGVGTVTTNTLANGVNSGVNFDGATFWSISGPTATYSIAGIEAGNDGQELFIYNNTAYNLTFEHDSGNEPTAANRIETQREINEIAKPLSHLLYDGNANRWRLLTFEEDTGNQDLPSITGTGLAIRTGASAYVTRSVTDAGGGRVSVSNGDGVSGNIILDVTEGNLNIASLGGSITTGMLPTGISAANIGGATVDNTEFGYLNGVTSSIQTQLNAKEASDSDLTAIAGLASNGLIARTGTGTAAARTITAGSSKVTITNGDGVSGNPTVDVDESNFDADQILPGTTKGDLVVFDGSNHVRLPVGTNGYFLKADSTDPEGVVWDTIAGSGTVTSVAVSGDTSISISGSPITTTGTIALDADSDLDALSAETGTGLWARTGTGTGDTRTITAATSRITVTNGDGVSGNPSIDVAEAQLDLSNMSGQVALAGQVSGSLPISNGGTGNTTATAGFDALAPSTTKGDLIVYNGTDNIRIGAPTNGKLWVADSTEASGWKAGGLADIQGTLSSISGTISLGSQVSGILDEGNIDSDIARDSEIHTTSNGITHQASDKTLTGTGYQSTSCSVTLPNAGTYLLTAHVFQAGGSGGMNCNVKLRNTTDSTDVANTVFNFDSANAGLGNNPSFVAIPIQAIYTVAGAKVIDVYAQDTDNSGGIVISDDTSLSYVKLSN